MCRHSRQRAAQAALSLAAAAATLCSSNHGMVSAFHSSLNLALPTQVTWAPQCMRQHQSPTFFSSSGRARRSYVRERGGSKGGLGSRSAADGSALRLRGTWVGTSTRIRKHGGLAMAPEDNTSAGGGGEAVESFMPPALQDTLPENIQVELSKINSDPVRLTLALNAGVLFLFASFAAFKLATVDHDIARGWTWYEILLRVPGDNFYRYEATVSENPIITKALTSCVAYGLGDLTAQLFTGKDLETIDLKRTARSATAGLLIHGPLCHFWIELMQNYLDFDGAWWNFIPKVIADQTVWSVFLNAAYSTMIMSLQGMSPDNVWGEVKSTAWPALTSSWRFWPLIHCFSFSTIIPKDLKLLFIDCMEIIWVTILSTVANKDRQDEVPVAAEDAEGLGSNVMVEQELETKAVQH